MNSKTHQNRTNEVLSLWAETIIDKARQNNPGKPGAISREIENHILDRDQWLVLARHIDINLVDHRKIFSPQGHFWSIWGGQHVTERVIDLGRNVHDLNRGGFSSYHFKAAAACLDRMAKRRLGNDPSEKMLIIDGDLSDLGRVILNKEGSMASLKAMGPALNKKGEEIDQPCVRIQYRMDPVTEPSLTSKARHHEIYLYPKALTMLLGHFSALDILNKNQVSLTLEQQSDAEPVYQMFLANLLSQPKEKSVWIQKIYSKVREDFFNLGFTQFDFDRIESEMPPDDRQKLIGIMATEKPQKTLKPKKQNALIGSGKTCLEEFIDQKKLHHLPLNMQWVNFLKLGDRLANRSKIVKEFISKGIDVRQCNIDEEHFQYLPKGSKSDKKYSPLACAIRSNSFFLIHTLLAHGAKFSDPLVEIHGADKTAAEKEANSLCAEAFERILSCANDGFSNAARDICLSLIGKILSQRPDAKRNGAGYLGILVQHAHWQSYTPRTEPDFLKAFERAVQSGIDLDERNGRGDRIVDALEKNQVFQSIFKNLLARQQKQNLQTELDIILAADNDQAEPTSGRRKKM